MTQVITTTVSDEFYSLAKENHLKWSEAMRVGLGILFADKGLMEYNSQLNLHRKMNLFRMEAEKALQKLSKLEEKNAKP